MTRALSRFLLTLTAMAMLGCGDGGSTNPTPPPPPPPPAPPPPPPPSDSPMTALINGEPFEAEFVTVNRSFGQVMINGAGLPQRAIGFQVPDVGTGTWTFAVGTNASAGVTIGSAAWIAGSNIGSGTVNITTSTNNRIAGTFEFSVVAQGAWSPQIMAVTDGRFDQEF